MAVKGWINSVASICRQQRDALPSYQVGEILDPFLIYLLVATYGMACWHFFLAGQ